MGKMNSYNEDILHIFNLDLPWEKLAGANILITGATGLIGGCLTEVLMVNPNRNYQVYASGRNEERARKRFRRFKNDKSFHFIHYDVLQPLESNICFDYIIHAASNASPNFFVQKPVEIIKSNIRGVENLMEYGLAHKLKRFVFVSSGEVYGDGNNLEFTEDYSGYVNCTTLRSCYPSSKRAAESLCIAYAEEYGVDVVIARPCHTYGPYFTEQDNRVYAQFFRNALNGEDIIMKSSGEQVRSWCYVVDCISALLYIMLKGTSENAYNVANSNFVLSIKQFADTIAKLSGTNVIIKLSSQSNNSTPINRAVFNIDKLKKLGWNSNFNFEESLKNSIKEQKKYNNENNSAKDTF